MTDRYEQQALELCTYHDGHGICRQCADIADFARRAADEARAEAFAEAATIAEAERKKAMRPCGAAGGVMERNLGRECAAKSIRDAIRARGGATVTFPALPIDAEDDKMVDRMLAKARGGAKVGGNG